MRVNNNNIRQWYLDFFFGRSRVKPLLPKTPNNDNCDTFQLSWRAKRDILNAHIEKTINSGEPMTGVSYEDFCNYYYDKHGYRLSEYDMKIEYQQALKGDNASLKEKEWRTNPEYRMPTRLYNSPEVIADRDAALEKYRNGEDIEPWEHNLIMGAYSNAYEGNKIYNAADLERRTKLLQNKISDILSEAGIVLSEDDELTFEVWGYEMTVSGNLDEDTLETINEILSDKALALQNLYHWNHSDEAKSAGISIVHLWSAEKYLKESGEDISVSDLSIDKDGKIVGLPEELDSFLKEYAIGEWDVGVDSKYADIEDKIREALYMKESFRVAINLVQRGGYDRLKSMTCKLTYKNGVLSC
ncbi:MAG: hypothetical protein J1F11_02415 [Oscillospiraceae bacterium]|nr:hypothetical protein [Oscillospiraceae bacterium]